MLSAKRLTFILAGIVTVRFLTLPAYPILDRTEARYAYIGELMVRTGNWVTPFIDHGVPFWAKPILSFWFTAASFSAFGVNEFSARLPAFLILAAVSSLVFMLGRAQRGNEFGLAAACIFASTSFVFYLGGTVMTDPALMLGITLVMTSFWQSVGHPGTKNRTWGYLFFVGIAFSVLAKGPVGAILPGLSIAAWAAQHRKWADAWHRLPWFAGTALTLLLVVPWFVLAEHRTPGFLHYFLIGEHFERFLIPHWGGDLYGAGRPWPIGTIWLFGLIASLPWSAILLILLFGPQARRESFKKSVLGDPWLSYLLFWFLAPLVVFTFAANILISYIAPSLPAFALLTAHAFRRFGERLDHDRFTVTAGIVPFLALAAVIAILMDPGSRYLPSQSGIVATFKKLTADRPSELIYAFEVPYSAKFYTSGQAKYVRDADAMAAALRDDGQYFVVPAHVYPRLPEKLRQRLEIVVQRNAHILIRSRPLWRAQ